MKAGEKILIYLQIEKRLRQEYYYLYQYLSDYGITMIPVTMENLFDFLNTYNRVDIILFEKSLRDRSYILKRCRKKLEYLIEHQKISLYHFSSFEKTELNVHYRYKSLYKSLPLPLSINDIGIYLALQIDSSNYSDDNHWPGRKSSSIGFLKAA